VRCYSCSKAFKAKNAAQIKKQRKSNYASKMGCNAIYFAIYTKKGINKKYYKYSFQFLFALKWYTNLTQLQKNV